MEQPAGERGGSSPEDVHLNRNRSFKSKQLVRSQAIRESQSPPRTLSPVVNAAPYTLTEAHAQVVGHDADAREPSPPAPTDAEAGAGADAAAARDSADDKYDVDEANRRQPVEIQITAGGWDEPSSEQRQRTRRWLGQRQRSGSGSTSHDLLSNSPRLTCVCGACAAAPCRRSCPDCRNGGGRRRSACPAKQDSGIGCSDDCPDCSDTDNGANSESGERAREQRKNDSLDLDNSDHCAVCRCLERERDRKERPKNVTLGRTDSDEKCEPSGVELVVFIKETLNKNPRDRLTLLKIERELHALVADSGRCVVRFPAMTSYGRMLVHRCAALFQLAHHLDHGNKGSVVVSKSGTSGGRLPCTPFRDWCTADFPGGPAPDAPAQARSILKRDAHSLDEGGGAGGPAADGAARSKSLEQRERDYERVRRRIFREDEGQWPWVGDGSDPARNKLVKVRSLEAGGSGGAEGGGGRAPVSKSHSFGGYGRDPPQPAAAAGALPHTRMLSRQGEVAWGSWRVSPSSSGYKTLSFRSTDSVTPSPTDLTGGVSPEPLGEGGGCALVWAVTDLAAVPPGAIIIHPQTGRPLTNADGSEYRYDPTRPPPLYPHHQQVESEAGAAPRRGRLHKQHSFIDAVECKCPDGGGAGGGADECRTKGCCCSCRRPTDKMISVEEVKTNGAALGNCKSHYDSGCQGPGGAIERRGRGEGAPPAPHPYPAHVYTTDDALQQGPTLGSTPYAPKAGPTAPAHPAPAPAPPLPYHDPANIRPLSLSGMVYAAAHAPYAYPPGAPAALPAPATLAAHCRMEAQVGPGGYALGTPPEPEHKAEPSFRIDQSYPYAPAPLAEPLAAPYYGGCALDPLTGAMHCLGPHAPAPAPRVYGGGVEGAPLLPYPLANVVVPPAPAHHPHPTTHHPHPNAHHYPIQYSAALPWPAGMPPLLASGCATPVQKATPPPALYLSPPDLPLYPPALPYKQPELVAYPGQLYPLYPTFAYPPCAPPPAPPYAGPPAADRRSATPVRRDGAGAGSSINNPKRYDALNSKRSSVNCSSRNTPLEAAYSPAAYTDDKHIVPYDKNTKDDFDRRNKPTRNNSYRGDAALSRQNSHELAARIQQIKVQMAHLNVREGEGRARGARDRRQPHPPAPAPANGLLPHYPPAPASHHYSRDGSAGVGAAGGGVDAGAEAGLTSAARAIVNTIRHLQAKQNLNKDNSKRNQDHNQQSNEPPSQQRAPAAAEEGPRDTSGAPALAPDAEGHGAGDSAEGAARPEAGAEGAEQPPARPQPLPAQPCAYRPYVFRQMSPATWCRRSPGPHPAGMQQRGGGGGGGRRPPARR